MCEEGQSVEGIRKETASKMTRLMARHFYQLRHQCWREEKNRYQLFVIICFAWIPNLTSCELVFETKKKNLSIPFRTRSFFLCYPVVQNTWIQLPDCYVDWQEKKLLAATIDNLFDRRRRSSDWYQIANNIISQITIVAEIIWIGCDCWSSFCASTRNGVSDKTVLITFFFTCEKFHLFPLNG